MVVYGLPLNEVIPMLLARGVSLELAAQIKGVMLYRDVAVIELRDGMSFQLNLERERYKNVPPKS